MADLVLRAIEVTSPSLSEYMRMCPLKAGLSKAAGSSAFVLGNPKAWLGTAYHHVLENILDTRASGEPLEHAAVRLWDEAISAQLERNRRHPIDQRFGTPESWPGYHLAKASVLIKARQLAAAPVPERPRGTGTAVIRERQFAAFGGALIGRPDVIREPEVVDYKSGAITEYDEQTQADVVKAAYVRQLRVYGYLVHEALGWWPARGVLVPMVGAGIEVPLTADDCTREATEAVQALTAFNAALSDTAPVTSLAKPGPVSCKWCTHKVVCASFWATADETWTGKLDGACVEGVLTSDPQTVHNGSAWAFSIDVLGGSENRGIRQISPLNPTVHALTQTLKGGERIRATGLRARPDGVLLPTNRTVIARVADLPSVVKPGGVAASG